MHWSAFLVLWKYPTCVTAGVGKDQRMNSGERNPLLSDIPALVFVVVASLISLLRSHHTLTNRQHCRHCIITNRRRGQTIIIIMCIKQVVASLGFGLRTSLQAEITNWLSPGGLYLNTLATNPPLPWLTRRLITRRSLACIHSFPNSAHFGNYHRD